MLVDLTQEDDEAELIDLTTEEGVVLGSSQTSLTGQQQALFGGSLYGENAMLLRAFMLSQFYAVYADLAGIPAPRGAHEALARECLVNGCVSWNQLLQLSRLIPASK